MPRALRVLTALLGVALLAPAAHAADLKVAVTERAHWPWPLTSPRAFDVASRAELAVFVEAMADSEAREVAPGDAASVARWKERMRRVLVENFAKARETCAAGALLCEGEVPGSWEALVRAARAGLGKLPAELAPWYAEQKPFHQGPRPGAGRRTPSPGSSGPRASTRPSSCWGARTRRGGMKNVLWNIDSQDWHAKTTGPRAAGRVLSLMLLWRRGIILFHDIHPKAPEALPRLWRQKRGSGVRWVDCREE